MGHGCPIDRLGVGIGFLPHPCSPQGAAPCSVDELARPTRRSLQAADISFGCWVGRPSATLLSHGELAVRFLVLTRWGGGPVAFSERARWAVRSKLACWTTDTLKSYA